MDQDRCEFWHHPFEEDCFDYAQFTKKTGRPFPELCLIIARHHHSSYGIISSGHGVEQPVSTSGWILGIHEKGPILSSLLRPEACPIPDPPFMLPRGNG